MRGDRVIQTQLLMAQAFGELADLIGRSSGYRLTPITFAELPAEPRVGTIACINDSGVRGWGEVVTPGGFELVIIWWTGFDWKVLGA